MESETAKTSRSEAREFLTTILSSGPVAVSEVTDAAKAQGFSTRTLERARQDAGVKPERKGGVGKAGKWYLKLVPKTATSGSPGAATPDNGKDRQLKSGGLSAQPQPVARTRARAPFGGLRPMGGH